MPSPLTIHKAKQFCAGAVERIGVDVDVIHVFGEGHQAQSIRKPVRKIVGAQLKAQAGRDEVEIETGMAEVGDAIAKFVEGPGAAAERKANLDGFAKEKGLQSRLIGEFRMLLAKVADHHAQIRAQSGDAGILTNIECRELLGEGVAIGIGKNPLREIVGKPFGKEMVDAESLKGMVENGGIATVLESGEKLGKGHGRNVTDASEIRDGEKVEGCLSRLHEMNSSRAG
jgi:hypothetical protein